MKGTVSIVGAGRVGRALASVLRQRGWRIGAVVTRSAASARAAVRAIRGGTPHAHTTADALSADLILIATPDDAIAPVAQELARLGRPSGASRASRAARRPLHGKVVLHTSGALDRSVLQPLAKLGAATGSLHPMQTFSGKRVPKLKGIVFAIEGAPSARRTALAIARQVSGVPVVVASRDKPAYHAAGVLAAGHALALVESATQLLVRIGFPRRRAGQTLLPLMREMLENFERFGPRASWTGPVARGDSAVVAGHMRALRKYPPELAQSYAALARLGARVLAKNPGAKLRELQRALANRKGGKI
jgi:predicted short-subunit dehydrogenase-like oxidoreductase (DUF2520 family)